MTEILCSIDGTVARLTLNTPERHNAMTREGVERFLEHLDLVETLPQIRVVLITGTGERTFCSGASLTQIRAGEMSGERFETLTDRLAALPIPKLAAMNGSAYGGGVEIGLCCDFRIGVRGMTALVPAARFGLCYPPNGIRRYVDTLGPGTAKRMLVAAERFGSDELLRVGYLHRVVDDAHLAVEAEAWAQRIAARAPLAVRAMLRACDLAAGRDWDPARVRHWVEQCNASADLQEGLQAAAEKRDPEFSGR